jgi:hypothetical protein
MMTSLPSYTCNYYYTVEYEPKYNVTTLDWFNIARCARERMTEYCLDTTRWRGERRSFYSSISKMDVNSKQLLD